MTAETKATDTDKPKVVRITVPATDEVTMDFLEAQGPRGVTTAVRLLIHSFVAEHGNVDVLSAVSGSLVGTRPVTPAVPQDQGAEQASSAETQAGASVRVSDTTAGSDAEVAVQPERDPVEPEDDTSDGEVVSQDTDTAPGNAAETGTVIETSTAASTDTGAPDGGSSVSDMEDLFRRAGNK